MYKRGQVTIFIILGIVVVAVLAWVFFIGDIGFREELTYEEAQRFVSSRTEPVRSYVEGCVESSAWVVLRSMGQYGGEVVPKIDVNNPRVELLMPSGDYFNVNYVAYKENGNFVNKFLSVNEMETEFENYLENVALSPENTEGFVRCIDDFDMFKKGFDKIEAGDLSVEVDFSRNVRIDITYPVTIGRSNYETIIEDYYVELPVDMNEIQRVGSRLINDVEAGNDLVETREYFVDKYTGDISSGVREDSVGIDWINTLSFDSPYNNINNYFFSLKYEHPELEEAYIFNMLVGAG
jgi:hypothetical protein